MREKLYKKSIKYCHNSNIIFIQISGNININTIRIFVVALDRSLISLDEALISLKEFKNTNNIK